MSHFLSLSRTLERERLYGTGRVCGAGVGQRALLGRLSQGHPYRDGLPRSALSPGAIIETTRLAAAVQAGQHTRAHGRPRNARRRWGARGRGATLLFVRRHKCGPGPGVASTDAARVWGRPAWACLRRREECHAHKAAGRPRSSWRRRMAVRATQGVSAGCEAQSRGD